MGHLEGRTALEASLSAAWLREFRKQQKHVTAALAATIPWDNPATWTAFEVSAAAVNDTILSGIFEASAFQIDIQIGQGLVSNTIIENRAAVWASQYSFELVKGVNATTISKLQSAISRGMQEGLSIDEITDLLKRTFGTGRAHSIAVTETTRASVEGQRVFIGELNKLGVFTNTFWLTARDNRVDDLICKPLDGVVLQNGVYTHPKTGRAYPAESNPPAHTNCRCGEDDQLIEDVEEAEVVEEVEVVEEEIEDIEDTELEELIEELIEEIEDDE